mgnify:CR=1 FL=1
MHAPSPSKRRLSRQIHVGNVAVGGDAPISVQSMTNTNTLDVDATVGQNAHSQVEIFSQAVDVTGLIITKLDGSARGGVVVALAEKFGIPVHAICVGEGMNDMQPFDARAFSRALVGLKS